MRAYRTVKQYLLSKQLTREKGRDEMEHIAHISTMCSPLAYRAGDFLVCVYLSVVALVAESKLGRCFVAIFTVGMYALVYSALGIVLWLAFFPSYL